MTLKGETYHRGGAQPGRRQRPYPVPPPAAQCAGAGAGLRPCWPRATRSSWRRRWASSALARSRRRRAGAAMMSSGSALVFKAPWIIIFPGLAVAITVVAINLFGDALIARAGHPQPAAEGGMTRAAGSCRTSASPSARSRLLDGISLRAGPGRDPRAGGRKRLGQVADRHGGDGAAAADRRAGDRRARSASTGRTWPRLTEAQLPRAARRRIGFITPEPDDGAGPGAADRRADRRRGAAASGADARRRPARARSTC